MAILLIGTCVNGKVRKDGYGIGIDGRPVWGITEPVTCEKCGGKGCAKQDAAEADAS